MMRSIRTTLLCAAAIVAASFSPSIGAAVDCVVVSGIDLHRQAGKLARIDESTIGIASIDGRQGTQLPLSDVVWIDCNVAPSASTNQGPANAAVTGTADAAGGPFLVILRDGQRLRGTPLAIGNDALTFRTPAFSDRVIPVSMIAGVLRVGGSGGIASESAAGAIAQGNALTQDEFRLTNNDTLTGVIVSADGQTLSVQATDGNTVSVEWNAVRQMRLALLPGTAASTTSTAPLAKFLVRTSDGEAIQCRAIATENGERLDITLPDGATGSVPATRLRSIEQLSGSVRLLSSLPPSEQKYVPFFPAAADAPASGKPAAPPSVMIAGKTTEAFLLVRPHSRWTWSLDGMTLDGQTRPTRLRTRYGIPDAQRYANAVIRILVNDKVVHEKASLTSGMLSEPIDIPLPGDAKSFTLEVDFGKAFDVQDDVVWFEPVLAAEPAAAR